MGDKPPTGGGRSWWNKISPHPDPEKREPLDPPDKWEMPRKRLSSSSSSTSSSAIITIIITIVVVVVAIIIIIFISVIINDNTTTYSLVIGKVIGEGAFGIVLKAEIERPKDFEEVKNDVTLEVAIKTLKGG